MKITLIPTMPILYVRKDWGKNRFVCIDSGNNLFVIEYPDSLVSREAREKFAKEWGVKDVKCSPLPKKALDKIEESLKTPSPLIEILQKRIDKTYRQVLRRLKID